MPGGKYMEPKKVALGSPCHKYIVRKCNDKMSVLAYTKSYISAMINNGYDYDLIIRTLELSFMELPPATERIDLSTYGENAKIICQNVLLDASIPQTSDCASLYKSYDPKVLCCQLCPLSKKYNAYHIDDEFAVIKYMLKGYDEWDYTMENLPSNFFISAMDVSLGLVCNSGIPIVKVTYHISKVLRDGSSIFSLGDDFFVSQSTFDSLWDMLSSPSAKRRGNKTLADILKLPEELRSHPTWEKVFKAEIESRISGAPELDRNSLKSLFDSWNNNSSVRKEPVPDAISSVSLFDMVSLVEENISGLSDNVAVKEPAEQKNVLLLEQEQIFSEIDSVEDSVNTTDISDIDFLTEQPFVDNSVEMDGDVNKSTKDETATDVAIDQTPIAMPISMLGRVDGDAIPSFILSKEEQDSCEIISCPGLPDEYIKRIKEKRYIPVEVVYTPDYGYCYISYVVDKYFLVPIGQECDSFYEFLSSHKNIEIICFSPYLLFGFYRINLHRVRNLFSIDVANEVLYRERLDYSQIFKDSALLMSMKSYRKSATSLKRKLVSSKLFNDYLILMGVCESLGSSYLYYNGKSYSKHFIRHKNGLYRFRSVASDETMVDVLYVVEKGEKAAINYLMYRLAESNDIWRLNFMVLSYSPGNVRFRLNKDVFEYAKTRMDIYLFDYNKDSTKPCEVRILIDSKGK